MTDSLNRCREAFESNFDAKYGDNIFSSFNGVCYYGPGALNADWIAFQKGWKAGYDTKSREF
jgi:hypothetical protein